MKQMRTWQYCAAVPGHVCGEKTGANGSVWYTAKSCVRTVMKDTTDAMYKEQAQSETDSACFMKK